MGKSQDFICRWKWGNLFHFVSAAFSILTLTLKENNQTRPRGTRKQISADHTLWWNENENDMNATNQQPRYARHFYNTATRHVVKYTHVAKNTKRERFRKLPKSLTVVIQPLSTCLMKPIFTWRLWRLLRIHWFKGSWTSLRAEYARIARCNL